MNTVRLSLVGLCFATLALACTSNRHDLLEERDSSSELDGGTGLSCEPVYAPDDSTYDRYEGTGADNRCETDTDCMASGCSGEVCAAESVASTCEAIAPAEGNCLCVANECQWTQCGGDDGDRDAGGGDLDAGTGSDDGGSRMCHPTVDDDDPYHDRFEGVLFDNACDQDSDCFVGGCSGEVCSATEGVVSTCEALPITPSGGCLCVDNVCRWSACGSSGEDAGIGEPDAGSGGDGGIEPPDGCTPTLEAVLTPEHPYYARFEGIAFDNTCDNAADCFVGGCSGEVCSANNAVITSCEVVPPIEGGPVGCGCVDNTCVWSRPSCGE